MPRQVKGPAWGIIIPLREWPCEHCTPGVTAARQHAKERGGRAHRGTRGVAHVKPSVLWGGQKDPLAFNISSPGLRDAPLLASRSAWGLFSHNT